LEVKRVHRGDDGCTDIGLRRVPKDFITVELMGQIDELIAVLGLARGILSKFGGPEWIARGLEREQRRLQKLIACIAYEGSRGCEVGEADAEEIDRECRELWQRFSLSFRFVVPQDLLDAALHLARAVCRRVERVAVRARRLGIVGEAQLKYLNRLSDLLYVYARIVEETAKH